MPPEEEGLSDVKRPSGRPDQPAAGASFGDEPRCSTSRSARASIGGISIDDGLGFRAYLLT
jgi:hypothetical protein